MSRKDKLANLAPSCSVGEIFKIDKLETFRLTEKIKGIVHLKLKVASVTMVSVTELFC